MNRQRLDSPLVYIGAHNVYYVKLTRMHNGWISASLNPRPESSQLALQLYIESFTYYGVTIFIKLSLTGSFICGFQAIPVCQVVCSPSRGISRTP